MGFLDKLNEISQKVAANIKGNKSDEPKIIEEITLPGSAQQPANVPGIPVSPTAKPEPGGRAFQSGGDFEQPASKPVSSDERVKMIEQLEKEADEAE